METLKIILDWGCPVLLVMAAFIIYHLNKRLRHACNVGICVCELNAKVIKERTETLCALVDFINEFNSWHTSKISISKDKNGKLCLAYGDETTENEEEDEEPTDSDTAQDA